MENAKVMSAGDCDIVAKSPAGAAYVKKVTHPPTTIPQEYLGTPDSSAPNVVCMEVKGETNIAPIITYASSGSGTDTANPGSMLFLSPSGGYVASYVFMQVPTNAGLAWSQPITWPSSGSHPSITNTTPPAILNSGYAFRNWYEDVSSFRTSYKSETYYLNATNFNNQGTVTSAKFKPTILRAQTILSILNSHEACGESTLRFVRALNLALGTDKEAFTITKNGVSGPSADYVVQIFECNDGPDPTIRQPFNTGIGEYSGLYHFLPSNATELMNLSSKSKTNPALDGAFVVHQPIDPVMLWDSSTSLPQKTVGTTVLDAPVLSMIRAYSYVTGIYEYFPLFTSASQTTTGSGQNASAVDLPWNNLDWSITIFEGLTVPPTVGTTLSSVPYITVKSYAGLELQPQFASSLRPFARLLPLPDRDALDIATCIFHSRPDALPASANDLGTIAATLFKYAPMVVDGIKTMFGMFNGKPKKEKKKAPVKAKTDKTVANLERQMLTMQLANQALRRRIKPGAARYVPEPVRKLPSSAPVPKPRRSLAQTRRA